MVSNVKKVGYFIGLWLVLTAVIYLMLNLGIQIGTYLACL